MKQNSGDDRPEGKTPDQLGWVLLKGSLYAYLAMAVVGILICQYNNDPLAKYFLISSWNKHTFITLCGIPLLATGVITIMSYFFLETFVSFRNMEQIMRAVLGPLPTWALLILALISSVGEELLFRGAIQPRIGILATATVFGLAHPGPGVRLSAWSLWAILAGLLLGWMMDATTLLWPGMITHFLVNIISMLRFKLLNFKGRSPKEPNIKKCTRSNG